MKTRRWSDALLSWIGLHPVWRWRRVQVWGGRLRAPTFDRWLALWLHRLGLLGAPARRLIETRVRPGMTVLDVGANQGLYAQLFSRLCGTKGRVLAFEPDDLLHDALVENVRFNEAANVRTFHLALGARRGAMTLYRSLLNSGDNRLSNAAAAAGPRQPVQVQIERLDELLPDEKIDFVKLDVQGWEMEVLRGMQGLLDAPVNARMAIYFEFWPQALRDAGSAGEEPLLFLLSHGFALHELRGAEPGAAIPDPRVFARAMRANAQTDLLALRGGS